jgi:hypothetical protein
VQYEVTPGHSGKGDLSALGTAGRWFESSCPDQLFHWLGLKTGGFGADVRPPDETFWLSDETIFMGSRSRRETISADNDLDQTMRFGHVGTHHQLGLRPILQEHSGRCGQASAPVDVRTTGAAITSGRRSFGCTGTCPNQFGSFRDDQSYEHSNLCFRGLHAVCPRHWIFRRAGLSSRVDRARPIAGCRIGRLVCRPTSPRRDCGEGEREIARSPGCNIHIG